MTASGGGLEFHSHRVAVARAAALLARIEDGVSVARAMAVAGAPASTLAERARLSRVLADARELRRALESVFGPGGG